MQAPKSNFNQLGSNLNPLKDATGVAAIDYSADIDNLIGKLDKLTTLYDTGRMDKDVIKYIPGMAPISYQGQIDYVDTKVTYAASTYSDMQQLEFNLEVINNQYINFSTMVLCLPIAFRKKTNKENSIAATMIPVNNFFAHWIKDVTVKRYGDNIAVLLINTTLDTYRYSESMLKHMPEKALATFQKELLYSQKKVIIRGNNANSLSERRNHIAAAANNSYKDDNIDDRIAKFNQNNALSTVKTYRIPLRYLVDLGLVNLPTAFDTKFIFHLEQKLGKLFESKARLPNKTSGVAADLPTTDPDANIYFNSTPYIQHEIFKLNDTFDAYLRKTLQSKRVLRTGIKPSPYQKTYEINVETQTAVIEFKGVNKQFSFLEISLVYDKSEQHNSVYDSYNAELAATHITSVQLENLNNKYGEINKKYDLTEEHDKYLMYRNFVGWATGQGCTVGPLTQYANNEIYKELIKYEKYYSKVESDERLYVDLRRGRGYSNELERIVGNDSSLTLTITLQKDAGVKYRLRVAGYYQGEYIYSMTNLGLLLSYKGYGIVAQNEMVALSHNRG